jgi:hypothetical protein
MDARGQAAGRLALAAAFALHFLCSSAPGNTQDTRGADPFYPPPARVDSSRLVLPSDLEYQGAFRLPRDKAGSRHGFTYLAGAMAYHPKGDPRGGKDGYPGSLFIAGHSSDRKVAEIGIPAPRLSGEKDYRSLPEAAVLAPFRDLGVLEGGSGIVVMGLEYLPAGGGQEGDKLHATLADGYLPKEGIRSYVTADPDFSNQTAPKAFRPDKVHCYNDYLFAVPESWSSRYAPGMRLAGGRHREGDLCGQGPALFLMAPWRDAASPTVATRAILRYKERGGALNGYSHGGDVYYAGSWVEKGPKSAVIFAGRKGLGEGKYGTYCNVQGFHDLKGYRPYVIFYDPEELGRVARGELAPHLPQPYAALDVNDLLFVPNTVPCHRQHLDALAYDAARGILYATERSRGEEPVVHVWKL